MSVTLNPGQSVTETATAYDVAGNVDPNASIAWTESSGGAVVALSGASAGNPSTVVAAYVADGTSELTATSSDPDGTVVATGVNNPSTITCAAAPPPSTDAVTVDIVDGTPA